MFVEMWLCMHNENGTVAYFEWSCHCMEDRWKDRLEIGLIITWLGLVTVWIINTVYSSTLYVGMTGVKKSCKNVLKPLEGKVSRQNKSASSETWGNLPNTRYNKLAGSLTRTDSGGWKFNQSSCTFYPYLYLCPCQWITPQLQGPKYYQ